MTTAKSIALFLIMLAGVSRADPITGSFVCTINDPGTHEILSGTIASVPGEGKLTFMGREVDAKWDYAPNCFTSRAGHPICFEPNQITVTFTSRSKLYSGSITVYENSSYGYLFDVSNEEVFWHRSFACTWN